MFGVSHQEVEYRLVGVEIEYFLGCVLPRGMDVCRGRGGGVLISGAFYRPTLSGCYPYFDMPYEVNRMYYTPYPWTV